MPRPGSTAGGPPPGFRRPPPPPPPDRDRDQASGNGPPRHGLARVLSKLGVCSRREAALWIGAGRVTVNGRVCRDPEHPTRLPPDRVAVDGRPVGSAEACDPLYLLLNKPRGCVTTASDERGRPTVFDCLAAARPGLPHLSAVGRLDQASEGLLLFTNDTAWAALLTDPDRHVPKTYHVQVNTVADPELCARVVAGVRDGADHLAARSARVLRTGTRNAWLEIVLEEGRNRHLRRLLGGLGLEVLRLVRVRIGSLELGTLPKGAVRALDAAEVERLRRDGGA